LKGLFGFEVCSQVNEWTLPVYAALDLPLFACGGKRVEAKIPSMREAERGDKRSDVGVSRKTVIFYVELTLS